MITLTGYKIIATIHEGVNTVIYRAKKEQNDRSVIIKILKEEYPTLEQLTRLKHEHKILQALDIPGLLQLHALEKVQNSLALILEDFGGCSLKKLMADRSIEVSQFLKIAIQLASTLAELHQNQIIHKDIKPHHILINAATGQVKIIDFSIATRLSRETQAISNPNFLEGTLAYMSPEQTGRMNRSIDYRTDFYSLGVTFYEMLTDRLPFQSNDPLELVHCHIAKQPVPPRELNSDIQASVSAIVMKLLAKTAEDRYQSAYGLKADLETCLIQLQETGKIENFIPGNLDKSGKFLIPQKLYGREAEVATLLNAFKRVSGGTTEMMLVSGYSGVGKSSLVNEVHKPIVRQRGYFIYGKFDQFKRNIPYASLIQAFQELMRQFLTENSEKIAWWKSKLLEALGPNGQVIIDVIPEVEKIIGPQPPVPHLGPSESQNRFNLVFQKFIGVFTQKSHPLVLFLDDLQWADSASLKLIELLMSDPDSRYLLLIGAYRDNEVSVSHPFTLTLDEIRKTEAIVNNITLQPLKIDDITELVADTLNCTTERAKPLAEIVLNKTQGNPFFLTQLLKSLDQDHLLYFNFNTGRWQWNIQEIQEIGIKDNVVDLMVSKLQKLSLATQKVLQLAACIGNQFNLDVLAIVNEESLSLTACELWEALQAGLILPLNNRYKIPLVFDSDTLGNFTEDNLIVAYKFLHDRVQQAAYSLIPDEHKKLTHLKIGELLLKHTPPAEIEENIFEIVNHLNIGSEFISDQNQKYELAKLNLIAGKKAKAATAYEPAVRYLSTGLEYFTESDWENHYAIMLELYVETTEAALLNTEFEKAKTLSQIALKQAKTLLDKIKVYEIQILFYIFQNQLQAALDTGLQVLQMLDISLAQERPGELNIKELENLPPMTDPYKLAAMRILMMIAPPAYLSQPEVFPLIAFTMVNLCIKYGTSSLAVYAYALYGLILFGIIGDIDSGYQFGQLSVKVLERFHAKELKPKIYEIFYAHIAHWKNHARETLEPLREGIQSGIDTGEIEYACYNAMFSCPEIFFIGEPLESVNLKQTQYIELISKLKQEYQLFESKMWRQLTLNLQGLSEDKYRLIGESFNEAERLPRLLEGNNYTSLFNTYLAKAILAYLFKAPDRCIENAEQAQKYEAGVLGTLAVAEHNFYYSLALLASYSQVSQSKQKRYLKQVTLNQQKMSNWAFHAPCNFRHKYELVEAEKARVLGKNDKAMQYYDSALALARDSGYIQEEALANELAAEFYFARGRERVAKEYLTDSYYGYVRWGAMAKVKDLESRYPQICSRISKRETTVSENTQTTTSTTALGSAALDFATVMKASIALSGELVLEKLLNKLIKFLMENAGAETALMILEKEGKLLLEAIGTVDKEEVILGLSTPVATSKCLPLTVINYVVRLRENLVLNDASSEGFFKEDSYIIQNKPKSILCMPLLYQGKLIGLLYLENNLTSNAFTAERLEVLKVLSYKAAISIENARLIASLSEATDKLKQANEQLEEYSRTLEAKVKERTLELTETNLQLKEKANLLEQTLQELQTTQTQLIQSEKMSSLGQLVAGVAHEINNPVNFIYGNLTHAGGYINDLLELIKVYQNEYPHPTPKILDRAETIDLDFLVEDLPKLLCSMRMGAERIRQIVLSLRTFSRLDEAEMKPVDIHEGIESTLLILHNRLKAKPDYPGIQVIKEYGKLPLVECYAGQLNQVLMNLLTNAIDSLEQYENQHSLRELQLNPSKICIRTEVINNEQVAIRIIDNGLGMTEEVKKRIFDPFFTTKSVGKGTGMGLSISYKIVAEKHGGELKCFSAPGQGAEFLIQIPVRLPAVRTA